MCAGVVIYNVGSTTMELLVTQRPSKFGVFLVSNPLYMKVGCIEFVKKKIDGIIVKELVDGDLFFWLLMVLIG